MNSHFKINGMHCPACKKLLEKRIGKIDGVTEVSADFETGDMEVTSNKAVTKAEIQKVLEGLEYTIA